MNQQTEIKDRPRQKVKGASEELSEHDFLNPIYRRRHESAEYVNERRASHLCFMASELVTCAQLAFENDTSGIQLENRGIRVTLEVAISIMDDLDAECHRLEQALRSEA